MSIRRLLMFTALLGSAAQAATYSVSAAFSPWAAQPYSVRAGVSDVLLGDSRLSLAVGNRAAELGVQRTQPLTAVGTLRLKLGGALVYGAEPGTRLSAAADGSVGPVALSASGQVWSAPAAALDPLSVWQASATDPSDSGWQADLSGRYRASRNVILTLSGQLGQQSLASLSGEYRASAYSYRLGAQGGAGVLGVLAGFSYRADSFTLNADALVGRDFGGSLSLDAPVLVPLNAGQAIGLSAYLNYEPWRSVALPLRYGLDFDVPLGQAVDGHLNIGLRGGSGGAGLRAGYTFTPGLATPGVVSP
ncbi:hypothetical protein DKM44_09565 [Deinococcus irradiatisoli]|uniref:Uncharacterized protein n=1 Tax=Deinococcus irradiatisoli TaxID=2202254 RepID=A0A2Z3JE49_9DEIO|nr:hypothetical protein [Deinococcus irradiatisoli]AWN23443.1 hypothetical protein DKM44_09565 [Deinococcus irradiatisoli]